MAKKYSLEDFLQIIETLRSDNGCPWDREQTHQTLRSCMVEEAYELVSAIGIYEKTDEYENLREELGDVLLQVIMHSQIAKEEGLFDFQQVVQVVAEKMVHRHPHVFASVAVENSEEVLKNWEELKKEEKQGKTWIASPLQEVPKELPALIRSSKVQKKMRQAYKIEESIETSIEKLELLSRQLRGEDLNVREEKNNLLFENRLHAVQRDEIKSTEEILGEMLLAITNIASQKKINVEQILADRIDDLIATIESNEC